MTGALRTAPPNSHMGFRSSDELLRAGIKPSHKSNKPDQMVVRRERQLSAGAAKALLEALSSANDELSAADALASIKVSLQPVLADRDRYKTEGNACKQTLGKTYPSFLVQLLKQAMKKLGDENQLAMRDIFISTAVLGLEGLSALRAFLQGRPHEVEILRYVLLRKLVSLQCFPEALHQAWLLYCALCSQSWCSADFQLYAHEAASLQPLPAPSNDQSDDVATLIFGTVLNMLLSIAEQKAIEKQLTMLGHVAEGFDTIMAWVR